MKKAKEFDDFLKTLVVRTPVEALGWDSVVHDLDAASGDQVFVYLHDVATRWTWMASIERNGFSRAAAKGGKLRDKEMQNVRGGLLSAVMQLTGKAPCVDANDAEKVLGIALGLYAGSTQTFKLANGFKDGGHFAVILYRKDAKSESASIRPFAFPGTGNKPIDAADFAEAVQQVEAIDRERHPEWMV